MNCPSCGVVLTGKVCACGYAVRLDKAPVVAPTFRSEPSAVIRQKMAEQLKEVNSYIAEYQKKKPGVTKREACIDFLLNKKGICHMLPKHLVDDTNQLKKEADEMRKFFGISKPTKSFDDAMDDYHAENS